MTVSTLLDMITRRLRSGASTDRYTAAGIVDAILEIGNDFVNRTRCTRKASTITLTASTAGFSTAAVSLFRPEYLCDDPKVWVTVSGAFTASVDVVSREEIFQQQLNHTSTSSYSNTGCNQPMVTFLRNDAGTTGGTIWPTPDAEATYVLNLMWDPPFCQDNAGTLSAISPGATSGSTVLNVPDEKLIPCVEMMAYVVEGNEIEAAKRDPTVAQRYEAHVTRNMGSGGFGVTSIRRQSISDRRSERWR